MMILGDCCEALSNIRPGSVDMCFADIPWLRTSNAWDRHFDSIQLATFIKPILSHKAPVLLMSSLSQLMALLQANIFKYRYDLIYEKSRPGGYLDANRRPLRAHETIYILGGTTFNPQRTPGKAYSRPLQKPNTNHAAVVRRKTCYDGLRFPRSVQKFSFGDHTRRHPTQKPIALLSWLVRSYSNCGSHILDPVSGSGATAVAALLCGRNVTCIEKDADYWAASVERVKRTIADNKLDVALELQQ